MKALIFLNSVLGKEAPSWMSLAKKKKKKKKNRRMGCFLPLSIEWKGGDDDLTA
jgi:hypothetical protein